MDKHTTLAEYMTLTEGDRKRVERAKALIQEALDAKAGDLAAGKLQQAVRILLQTSQDQFWRVL